MNEDATFETHDDEYCQDCGRLLMDDMKGYDDAASAPYVTASGDLFCIPCGRSMDAAEERQQEEGWGWWDYRTWSDLIEGEEGGTYIGPDNDTIGGGQGMSSFA